MVRPLLVELAGGLYHVTSRGGGRERGYILNEQNRQAIPLPGLVKSLKPSPPTLWKFMQKFSFVTSVRDVPYLSWNEESFCSGHTYNAFFDRKKCIITLFSIYNSPHSYVILIG